MSLQMMSANTPTTLQALGSMLKTGKFSDFSIFCGTQEFKVHKTVIYGLSKYFSTVCESQFKEAEEGCLRLDEENPHVVNAAIQHMYTEKYDYPAQFSENPSPMHFNLLVYILADMLLLDRLKIYAILRLEESARDWNFEDLAKAVPVAYAAPEGYPVRQSVVHIIKRKFMAVDSDEITNDERFNEIARNTPAFGIDLARTMAKELKTWVRAKAALVKDLECECDDDEPRSAICKDCSIIWELGAMEEYESGCY